MLCKIDDSIYETILLFSLTMHRLWSSESCMESQKEAHPVGVSKVVKTRKKKEKVQILSLCYCLFKTAG